MRYGAVLQCSLWGWRSWSYHGSRATDAAEELPLVAEEPLVAVDAQEDEPARDEAQQMDEEDASSHREQARPLDRALLDGLADPGDDLVEHLVERRRRLEAEHVARLLDRRHAALHVVLERVVVHDSGTARRGP